MYLPDDVERRLRLEYSPGEAVEIMAAFETLAKRDPAIGARVYRCILHLAQGNLRRALDLAAEAQSDFRDVVYWAEYDEKGKTRLHDFTKPFSK